MSETKDRSMFRECFIGIAVAVIPVIILAALGLQQSGRSSDSKVPFVPPAEPSSPISSQHPTFPEPAAPPSIRPFVTLDDSEAEIDLTGVWWEPGGNVVSITHRGPNVILQLPLLGTTQYGTLDKSLDQRFRYVLKLAYPNGTVAGQFQVAGDGNRMEGWVSSGFERYPASLRRGSDEH